VSVDVIHFTDPGCPYAWSAWPAHVALMWRFGDQLDWRHVMIGLTERPEQYEARGYTPLAMAQGNKRFRLHGMPMAPVPKARVAATARACRAVVAVRQMHPERELAALRALQFLQFCSGELLDDDAALGRALDGVPGVDGAAVVARLDSREVTEAYALDRAEARTAEGTAAHAQGKTAATDGPVRFTAPSLIFRAGSAELMAGGWQPEEAYDVLLANLDPSLVRRPSADNPEEVLHAFPDGLATAEVAAVMALSTDEAEDALLELMARDGATRVPAGNDALWVPARRAALRLVA
jgi:2-hydroxychromene-2-carboxylate isomerase